MLTVPCYSGANCSSQLRLSIQDPSQPRGLRTVRTFCSPLQLRPGAADQDTAPLVIEASLVFLDFFTVNQTHDMFSGAFSFHNSKNIIISLYCYSILVESAVTFPVFKSKLDCFCTKSANKEVVNILGKLRVVAGGSLVRTLSISLGLFDFKVKFVKGFILPPHFYSLLYFTFYLTSILTEARSVEVLKNECNKAPPLLVPVFVTRLLEPAAAFPVPDSESGVESPKFIATSENWTSADLGRGTISITEKATRSFSWLKAPAY